MSADERQRLSSPKTAGLATVSDGREVVSIRRISSEIFLAGQRELIIEHNGEEYRLSVTSKGKLILTK